MEDTRKFNIVTLIKSLLRAFNLQKGIIPTLKDLLIIPHVVSNHYIKGNREKYISPAQLFIVAVSLVAFINIFSNEQDIDKDPLGVIELIQENQKLKPVEPIFRVMNKSPFSYCFFLIIPFAMITRILSYKSKRTFAMHLVSHMYTVFFIVICFTLIDLTIGGFLDDKMDIFEDIIGFSILFITFSYYTFSLKKFLENSFPLSLFKIMIMLFSCIMIFFIIRAEITTDLVGKRFNFIKFFKEIGLLLLIPILLMLIQKSITYIKKRIK